MKEKKQSFSRKLFVVIILVFIITSFFCIFNHIKFGRYLGQQLEDTLLIITQGSELLDVAKTEEEKSLLIEMMQSALLNDIEMLNTMIDRNPLYEEFSLEDILLYILDLRLNNDNEPQVIAAKIEEVSDAIKNTGILGCVQKDRYSYLFDLANVKEKIKTIKSSCE